MFVYKQQQIIESDHLCFIFKKDGTDDNECFDWTRNMDILTERESFI